MGIKAIAYLRIFRWLLPAALSYACQGEKEVEPVRPNILIAISDDQSFRHTGIGGFKAVRTPAFDRVAREGILFANCFAASPGCAPSRGALVTGRYPWQNEQSGQHAAAWAKKYVPFVDVLEENGFKVGYTGKGVGPFKYAENEADSLLRGENAAGYEFNSITYSDTALDERPTPRISKIDYFANFKEFMGQRSPDRPFCFWYGGFEPHRPYDQGSWVRSAKKPEDAEVPGFLPDSDEVVDDLLDYAVEIDWFDKHLERMLTYLEQIGELDNTIVLVTSDNGMPFPRAKANSYEYGIHVPMAIRYPKAFGQGLKVDDLIDFVDFAPTLLDLTGTSSGSMLPITGKSFKDILLSKKQGVVDPSRNYVFSGRERHSSSRYRNWGYPQRAIRSREYLLIWNIKPERWPAGAPQRIDPEGGLFPLYGIDPTGRHHSEWAFTDIDESPSKSYLIENYFQDGVMEYFSLAVAKRPEYELYHIVNDPDCLVNLTEDPSHREILSTLKDELRKELVATGDPRVVGPDREVFDSYPRYSPMREFPSPGSK